MSRLHLLVSRSGAMALIVIVLALNGCGSSAQTATSRSTGALAPLVHLPADQANHPKVANEWWYVVGHLRSGHRTFGFEMTLFRFNHLRAPGLGTPINILRSDVAITDEANQRFHQKVTYYFPTPGQLSATGLNQHEGAQSLTGGSPSDMRLHAQLPAGALTLHLRSQRQAMYVGGRGYIPFGNGFTYYYSLTNLSTSGVLRLNGHVYHVSGISWLDHQWGNWKWSAIHGWTWMALQLNNGVQLSVFDFRGTRRIKAASVSLPGGQRTFYDVSITPLGSWLSPHTGGKYPSGWVVRIPAMHARLRVEPAVKDQEVLSPGVKEGSYWEGSGRVTGMWSNLPVSGLSYTELTGFAGGFISGQP